MKFKAAIIGLIVLLGQTSAHAASQLSVGGSSGRPGDTVAVTNSFASNTGVVALQYDVLFDGGRLASTTINGGNALLGHNVHFASLGTGTNRVVVYSLSNAQLTNGVLASLYFTIASNAPVGVTSITFANGILADASGNAVASASYVPGSLTITAGPATLGAIRRAVGGLVEFDVSGSYSGNYVIQASTNLVQWTPVATNIAVNGLIQWQDANSALFTKRFYRAIVAP